MRREGELLCVFREGVVGEDEGGKREREVREEKSSCRRVVMSRIVEAEMKFWKFVSIHTDPSEGRAYLKIYLLAENPNCMGRLAFRA